MPREAFSPEGAVAVGPYSHAVAAGEIIYFSGQSPIDPKSGKLVEGGIAEQTLQCFKNLFHVLDATGLTPEDVVKVNVFLTDMDTFSVMNSIYAQQFSSPYPARSTVGVASLPLGAGVEIEMIARKG